MKLLLVEDDLPLGQSLSRVLVDHGHLVLWVRTAADARAHLHLDPFEVVLLDIVLPDGSGLDLLRGLRSRGATTPVMMLTARDAVSDRVTGLDLGADDYLPKPFAIEELLSRLRVLQRRAHGHISAAWQVGDLAIDTARRRVTIGDAEVLLSAREYDILVTLAADPGRVLTRKQIESALVLTDAADSNAVDVHVSHLRKKIGTRRIGTVRGVGYVLEVA